MGFQYFYGFLGGETDQWTPYLFQDHTRVYPWIGHPGYNLTTDLADNAISYLHGLNAAAPDKPFFLYYVPGGSHSPHQPTKEWIDKFHGKFDMGYEKLREEIFANQKRLGVIPADTQLTPWPEGQAAFGGATLPRWDSLTFLQKKLYAREAEVFAAYTAYTDHEIGRVDPGSRGRRQARQHPDHLHRRRQRHERRRHRGGHLQSDDRLQRHPASARGAAASAL